ncbi:MAG: hypothetical protein PHN78_06605 [Dehalococcoidales bacterium]|nr:hypothetical protein [Dehalococcoidales bacterium]
MKNALFILFLIALLSLGMAGCSGDKPAPSAPASGDKFMAGEVREPSDEEFMRTAIKSLTELEVSEVCIAEDKVTITYEQMAGDSESALVRQWLDAAMVAMSFMEKPLTIIIIPMAEDKAVTEVTIEAADVASLLSGTISTQEMLSRINIK